jgi:hypothetical protein
MQRWWHLPAVLVAVAILLAPQPGHAQRVRRDLPQRGTVAGSLGGASEIHDWIFFPQAGTQIRLRATVSAPLDAEVTLTAANGRVLWTGIALPDAPATSEWITIPRAGLSTVTVRSANGSGGSYTLTTGGADQQFTVEYRGELALGQSVLSWLPGQHHSHSYSFVAQSGQQIELSARGDGTLQVTLRLQSPGGRVIFEGQAQGQSGAIGGVRLVLPESGRYTVVVGAGGETSGAYELRVGAS